MQPFNLFSKCPICSYGGDAAEGKPAEINGIKPCHAKASDVPLRCQHCVDLEEYANFPRELYHASDGNVFRPYTKVAEVVYDVEVEPARPSPENPLTMLMPVMETRVRKEKVIDLEATLQGGPISPPKTIKHVHRHCGRCGNEWPELVQE